VHADTTSTAALPPASLFSLSSGSNTLKVIEFFATKSLPEVLPLQQRL